MAMRCIASAALILCRPSVAHASGSASEAGPMPEMLGGSSTYQSITQKVNALEEQIAETEQTDTAALEKKRAEYQVRLQYMQQANNAFAIQSRHIAHNIEEVNADNKKWRQEAEELQNDVEEWRRDWSALRSNITTALEVTRHTLGTLKAHQPRQLDVLTELDAQEAVQQAKVDHLDRLAEIAPVAKLSFLQLNQKTVKGRSPDPKSVLRVLEDGFADLAKANRRKQEELDTEFKAKFRAQRVQRDGLWEEQRTLNGTLANATILQSRLKDAVTHLRTLNAHLEERGISIRGYAQRLGSRPVPGEAQASADHDATATTSTTSPTLSLAWSDAAGSGGADQVPWKTDAALNLRAFVATAKARLQLHAKAQIEKVAQVVESERQRAIQSLSASTASEPKVLRQAESPLSPWMQWLR